MKGVLDIPGTLYFWELVVAQEGLQARLGAPDDQASGFWVMCC